ncbi:hypothetical protein JRO89_XS01G0225200 [Xanthoceras sorbifolium]|uniref:Uncharacterized protein n=1 Tax=Xanthoceras sorbifolium TaxID=99658 RepID=A0ABQ8IKL0_9ROSI|nr:hypothetical protein JRO89_XS01G0225200 [Xanthoceras sorbifolium]
MTWEKMKSKFMSKFLPPDYEQWIYVQIQKSQAFDLARKAEEPIISRLPGPIVEGIEDDEDLFVGMAQRVRVAEIVKGNEEDEYWWPGLEYIYAKSTFSLKYKSGQMNKVADALSRRAKLLVTVASEVTGFEFSREHYAEDTYFQQVWNLFCEYQDAGDFLIHDGYLFKSNKLRIPQGSLREKIIRELHCGELGRDKMTAD